MRKLTRFLVPISALALAMPGFAAADQAEVKAKGAQADEIEEIVVSGLRGKPRSAVDSAVPIDTFDIDAIENVAENDVQNILQTLVPSYNVAREPVSDGSTFIRPATLRGLPSHHTLVLINGKRRHRSALVSIGGDGTQGPDVATIPSSAIQSIEVLRDGASSQYGSDAIAGVINFNLKENSEGISLEMDTGQYFEGDGNEYTVTGNIGLPLGENGFVSISGEVHDNEFTERAEQYCDSWFCADPTNPRFTDQSQLRQDYVNGVVSGIADDPFGYNAPYQAGFPVGLTTASVQGQNVMPWGQPNNESQRLFINAGYELGNGNELYGWTNYSASKGDGGFFYRYPGNGTIEFTREADGEVYYPLEKFPGGFTPRFEGEVQDIGAAAGYRGEGDNGFSYDVSARYGSNEVDYRLFNTVNPSMGRASPTDFKPGTLTNTELQFQLDLINEFDGGFASPVVLAYGLSYMDEEYDVGQSIDVASYQAGPHALQDPYNFCSNEADFSLRTPNAAAGGGDFPSTTPGASVVGLDCTNSGDPVYTVVGVGSNGFPGYSPAFSETYSRDSYAVYGDLSADINDSLYLQGAIRYEDYSDFGDQIVGKIAARWKIADNMAIRGSVGTGFRAPTPGQQGTTNVSTRLPNGFPVATGLFPASGPVAQALGAAPLKAETSTSYTLGLTADIGEMTLTIDLYQIDLEDRLNAISTRDVSTDPLGDPDAYANYLALSAAGVSGAESIGGVFYFTNAFDSKTQGVDIVASYPFEWSNGHSTTLQYAMNWNKNELTSDASAFLNLEDQYDFENFDPNIRWNATAIHNAGDLTVMGRLAFYGESSNSNGNTLPQYVQTYSSTMFFDLEGAYRFNDNWRVAVGARNLFDQYPDKQDRIASNNDQCCGRVYNSGNFASWQGGYYYGKVSVNF